MFFMGQASGDPWANLDGRLNAPLGGNFQRANFFTSYAPQFGQVYSKRTPWKNAGADYAIGIPAASISGGLKDPSTATLPSGATYSAGVVTITGSVSVTFDGYDFGLHNGIAVNVLSTFTGPSLNFKNTNFKNGTATAAKGAMIGVNTATIAANSFNLSFLNCVVDMNSMDAATQTASGGVDTRFVVYWGSGTFSSQYTAYLNAFGRFWVWNSTGQFVSQFDYVENVNYNTADHGEAITTDPQNGNTCPLVQFSFVTFLTPLNSGAGMTASLYASGGVASTGTITKWQEDHCTFIVNPFAFLGGISGTTLTVDSSFTAPLGQPIASGETLRITNSLIGTAYTIGSQISGSPIGQAGTYNISPSGSVADGSTLYISVQSVAVTEFANVQVVNAIHDTNYVDPTGSSNGWVHVLAPTSSTYTNNVNMLTGGAITGPGQINTAWG